jgi:hypothetical protein
MNIQNQILQKNNRIHLQSVLPTPLPLAPIPFLLLDSKTSFVALSFIIT